MGTKDISTSKNVYDDGVAVVRIKGGIITNLQATEVVSVIDALVEEGRPPQIILALDDLNYVDSYSFNWIIQAYRDIADKGGRLVICGPNELIEELFQVTNFGKAVPIYRTEDEARTALVSGDESARIACQGV